MASGEESGEFVAIGVSEDQLRMTARVLQGEVDKLKAALRAITQRMHSNYHDVVGNNDSWEECARNSCREVQAALGIMHTSILRGR
jgi:hypothetical protein